MTTNETRTKTDITITVTRSVALGLLALAGMDWQDDKGRWNGQYWHLDEALTVALVEIAENDLRREVE